MSSLHNRAPIETAEQGMEWLRCWSDARFASWGALPKRPWRRTPERELRDIAMALLKARATVDAVLRAEGMYRP